MGCCRGRRGGGEEGPGLGGMSGGAWWGSLYGDERQHDQRFNEEEKQR